MRNCYYHHEPIKYFCSHSMLNSIVVKCTLPLCDTCLSIHQQQTHDHLQHNPLASILSIESAQNKALNWILMKKGDYETSKRLIEHKLHYFRGTLMNQLDEELEIVKMDLLAKINALEEYEQNKRVECLIRAGSIKELITIYEKQTPDLEKQPNQCQLSAKNIKINFNYDCFRKTVSEGFGLGIISQSKQKKMPNLRQQPKRILSPQNKVYHCQPPSQSKTKLLLTNQSNDDAGEALLTTKRWTRTINYASKAQQWAK